MKKNLLIVILFAFSAGLIYCLPQQNANKQKYSFGTYLFLQNKKNIDTDKYYLQNINGVEYTKAYAKVDSNYSISAIEQLGCKELVKTKTFVLLSVPSNNIELVSQLDFIEGIEVVIKPQPDLDKALPTTNVDKVHNGEDLKRAYYGQDVIVGVVDYGIDFTHPMFLNDIGQSRIKRVMMINSNQEFVIYSDPDSIKNIVKYSSIQAQGHGTHVLGIAAGSEVQAKIRKYSGVAPAADIVVSDLSQVDILESFAYMFAYADSVGKPIVINNSYGYRILNAWYNGAYLEYIGDAIEELIDEYPKGKILVFSAGNEGRSPGHFICNLGNNDSAKVNVPTHSYTLGNNNKKVQTANLVFHREEGVKYSFNLKFKKKDSNEIINIMDLEPDSEEFFDYFPSTITIVGNDTFEIRTGTNKIANSSNHRMVDYGFVVYSYPHNQIDTLICTIYADKSNTLLGWSISSDLSSYQQLVMKSANVHSTYNNGIGFPGTLENVVTVGAYVSKQFTYYNILHSLADIGDIAEFSSIGTTVDGRIKPDITAPGIDVFSAKNGFDSSNKNLIVDTSLDNKHYFWTAGGTSMSAPMVAGIVALMLEINPKLTQLEIKDILRITAINDEYTGNAKVNKSIIWGWGKIDAYALMKNLEGTSIDEKNNFEFSVYPNPVSDGIINIHTNSDLDRTYIIYVYDQSGKLVYLSSMQGSEKQFDIWKLNIGAYFIRLSDGINTMTSRLVVE